MLGLHIFNYYKFLVIDAFKTDHFYCIYNSVEMFIMYYFHFCFPALALSSTTQCRCDCTFKLPKSFERTPEQRAGLLRGR